MKHFLVVVRNIVSGEENSFEINCYDEGGESISTLKEDFRTQVLEARPDLEVVAFEEIKGS